jgi:exoribonuclease-2
MKDGLVRAETLPLVFRVPGTEGMPRGARVRARVAGIDLLTLDLHAQLVSRLGGTDAAGAEEALTAEGEDEGEPSGPLTLAIAVDEPAGEAAEGSSAAVGPAT